MREQARVGRIAPGQTRLSGAGVKCRPVLGGEGDAAPHVHTVQIAPNWLTTG